MTSAPDVIAHGILDAARMDTLFVQWQLIHDCNYSCSYCHLKSNSGNCVFVKDRLMAMACKLMSLRRRQYYISLTGGEPTLHPFLPDIVRYMATCGRNAKITVETNGSREPGFYLGFIKNLPPYSLKLKIYFHAQFADLKNIISLTASIIESSQFVHVEIVFDPAQMEKQVNLMRCLLALRQHMPFDLSVTTPACHGNGDSHAKPSTPEHTAWPQNILNDFANAALKGAPCRADFSPPEPQYMVASSGIAEIVPGEKAGKGNAFQDFYCCAGANLIVINPAGYYSGASCCQAAPSRMPLWMESAQLPETQIIRCRYSKCPGKINEVLPKFRNLENARQWNEKMRQLQPLIDWEIGPAANPLSPQPALEAIVRSRLKNLLPASEIAKKEQVPEALKAIPALVHGGYAEICRVYSLFTDEWSKEIFLRALKAAIMENTSYLASASSTVKGREAAPSLAISLQIEKNNAAAGKIILNCILEGQPVGSCDMQSLPDFIGKKYFTTLVLEAPGHEREILEKLGAHIYDFRPQIHVSLSEGSLLAIPQWFAKNFPDYSLALHQGTEATILHADIGAKTMAPELRQDILSIIIYCHDHSQSLPKALDSVLLHGGANLEVIVVDDASSDNSWNIIGEYAGKYPSAINPLKFSSVRGIGAAVNFALKGARGKYIAFMSADGMAGKALILEARNLLAANDADIAVFETVAKGAVPFFWPLRNSAYSGAGALEAYLQGQFGPYSAFGHVYSRALMDRFDLNFQAEPGFESLLLDIRAFLGAAKVITVDKPGYFSSIEPMEMAPGGIGALVKILEDIATFRKWHPLAAKPDVWNEFLACLYQANRANILVGIGQSVENKTVHELLNEKALNTLASARGAWQAILEDGIRLFGTANPVNCAVRPENIDWKKDAGNPAPPQSFTSYGNADEPLYNNPLLSVIMPYYNNKDYLAKSLDSVLSQSMDDLELIIFDDHSSDGGYELLRAYADIHPKIRLYRMDYNCLQGVCRNLAIDRARGKYLVFVDADDICQPDYFANAVKTISANSADIAILSISHADESGNIIWANSLQDASMPGNHALAEFYGGNLEPAPWGKIYLTSFIKSSQCHFEPNVYHQDVPFFLHALAGANKVTFSSAIGYHAIRSQDSATRPKYVSYRHFHSAYKFYANMQRLARDFFGEDMFNYADYDPSIQISYNLENVLLEKCAAFMRETGAIPIEMADLEALEKNPLFILGLLKSVSKYWNEAKNKPYMAAPRMAAAARVYREAREENAGIKYNNEYGGWNSCDWNDAEEAYLVKDWAYGWQRARPELSIIIYSNEVGLDKIDKVDLPEIPGSVEILLIWDGEDTGELNLWRNILNNMLGNVLHYQDKGNVSVAKYATKSRLGKDSACNAARKIATGKNVKII